MSKEDDLAVYLSRESLREMQENMNTMKKEVLLRISLAYGLEYNDLLERYLPEKIRKIPGKRVKASSEPIKSSRDKPQEPAKSAEDPPSRSVSPAPRLVNKKIVIKRSVTTSPASTVSSSAKSSARSTTGRIKK